VCRHVFYVNSPFFFCLGRVQNRQLVVIHISAKSQHTNGKTPESLLHNLKWVSTTKEVMKMGYIAPIPHHQYKQYQERELKVEKHPFTFLPVQPVKSMKNKSQAHPEETETSNHVSSSKQRKTSYQAFNKPTIPSKLLAQLTGKGNHFNEYV
jgi:hypothetical protein